MQTLHTQDAAGVVTTATPRYAVRARNLCRQFGVGKSAVKVIKKMNMSLKVGHIYGLLGPSGCGKTTLLKMILGRLRVDSGTLQVFGRLPGSYGHLVPGVDVGYMPQELALYGDFTIYEMILYYSKLYGMALKNFEERKNFLIQFLDLPEETRMVKHLSGGQKRRVSLCVALIHNPRLLILDEPTVGVDPMLRTRIWNYLQDIASTGTSIIITTHYIEEARQAHDVGLMRHGRLLAEGSPDDLMSTYGHDTLEDVFLQICRDVDSKLSPMHASNGELVDDGSRNDMINSSNVMANVMGGSLGGNKRAPLLDDPASIADTQSQQSRSIVSESDGPDAFELDYGARHHTASGFRQCWERFWPRGRILRAEIWKGAKRMQRNLGFIVFQFFIPAIQVCLFCVAIGRDPEDLNLTIINQDVGFNTTFDSSKQAVAHTMETSALTLLDMSERFDDPDGGGDDGIGHSGAVWRVRPKSDAESDTDSRYYNSIPATAARWAQQLFGTGGIAGDSDDAGLTALVDSKRNPHISKPVNLGDNFVKSLSDNSFNKKHSCDAVTTSAAICTAAAVEDVREGKSWGYVLIPRNFTRDLYARYSCAPAIAGGDSHDKREREHEQAAVVVGSTIRVKLDQSNQQIALFIESALTQAFTKMVTPLAATSHITIDLPIRIETPVYGEKNPKFTDFIAPGMIISIAFAGAIGLTAVGFVMDVQDGCMDRQWAAGIHPSEIFFSILFTQFCVLFIQICILLAFALGLFQLPMEGSLVLVVTLASFLGISGMLYGLCISSVVSDVNDAMNLAMGSFFPFLLLSGVIWPVEGIPSGLRYISLALPTTWAATAMRSIMSRGWGIYDREVWMGFVVVGAWCVFFFILSMRGLKNQH